MARKKNENDYALQTIISKDAAKFLADLAKADDRSLVKYTKRIIMEHIRSKGYVEASTDNVNASEDEHINKETQKKNSSAMEQIEVKQSANCTQSSIARTRSKNTKVAPVSFGFVK